MEMLKKLFTNDQLMFVLVLVNVISIFVGGFYPNSYAFICIDSVFTIVFLIEAIVKIKSWTFEKYWKDSWNKFDFIVTIIALPSLVNLFITSSVATNIVLSFRVLRAFKSFRLFEFIPNISSVLRGIVLACKASFMVALGFIALLLIVSILSSSLFGNVAPEFFGNPADSLYTTFRLFSIEGWYEIPDAIAAKSGVALSAFAKMYFALMLFVGGILGMSLINAIFVDAAVSDNNDDLKAQVNELEGKIDRLTQMLEESEQKKRND